MAPCNRANTGHTRVANQTGLARLLLLCGMLVWPWPAEAQNLEVTPFAGFESSGSYPLENPTTIEALRADAGGTYGVFVDYHVMENVQAEFYWVGNSTTYSQQDAGTGQYGEAFTTSINQYQFGVRYHLRDRGNRWRPYFAGSLGFTHDSNGGNVEGRTAAGFGLGGGIDYQPSRHIGIRWDARWMPTYGSQGMGSVCDDYGECYQAPVNNYLERFHIMLGLSIRP